MQASSSTLPVTVAVVDLASVIAVDVPGLTGGFQLDAALDLTVGRTNQKIVPQEVEAVTVAGGDIVEPEGESFTTKLDGAFAEVMVHPEGFVDYSGVVHIIPSMFVSFLGQTWSVPIVPWTFAPQRVHLPLPDVTLSPEVLDFGEVTVGAQTFRSYVAAREPWP